LSTVRRLPLSRERVLRAAVAVVDRDGLDALTMRRLGEELGVEAMSLYRWVPGKAALLDGVHETILAELEPPSRTKRWTSAVAAYARGFRAVLVAHPRALPIFATRPAATAESLRHVERGLRLLRDAGFGADDAISALQTVVTFVVGHALSTHGPLAEDERSAPRYDALDAASFPALREAAATLAEHDVDAEFEFGLDAILRGLEEKLGHRG
jgi:AcrR family transcriptional regulator